MDPLSIFLTLSLPPCQLGLMNVALKIPRDRGSVLSTGGDEGADGLLTTRLVSWPLFLYMWINITNLTQTFTSTNLPLFADWEHRRTDVWVQMCTVLRGQFKHNWFVHRPRRRKQATDQPYESPSTHTGTCSCNKRWNQDCLPGSSCELPVVNAINMGFQLL